MRIFYYKDPHGNFGDDLNEWIWSQICPDLLAQDGSEDVLVGIGTLLGMDFPEAPVRKFVLGTGAGLKKIPQLDQSWIVGAVRGPFTARILRLPDDVAMGDGALLLRETEKYRHFFPRRTGVGFIPHISSSRRGNWAEACRIAGLKYIDPAWDFHIVLESIAGCEMVVCEAMHGAICADTLSVPWVPVASSPEINSFKWNDWAKSLGLAVKFRRISSSSAYGWLRGKYWPLTGWAALANGTPSQKPEDIWHDAEQSFSLVIRRSAIKSRILRIFQGAWHRFFEPIIDSPAFRRIFAWFDRYLIKRAAVDLAAAALANAQLSESTVREERVTDLLTAIDKFRVIRGLKHS